MNQEKLNELKDRLAKQYPAWHFWRARTEQDKGPTASGDLMATRMAHLTDDLVSKGLARTLPYGIGPAVNLEEQLAEQAELAEHLGLYTAKTLH